MESAAVIATRYMLREQPEFLLGRGGMGEVYRGEDTLTGESVAIKVLRGDRVVRAEEGGRSAVLLERFKREGEILRHLNHPNIVGMLGVDETEGRQYLVMEYVAGGSLRERLAKGPRLSLRRVVEMALEIADALSRVHHLGIVHRDIKPDNVLLMDDETPRLTDFGVAHLSAGTRVTGDGAVIGTLDYLSPEACTGLPVDARSDIWSFGVMLFEMLVGSVPFVGETPMMSVAAITASPTPEIKRPGATIPEELRELVGAMLVKERKGRINSARKIAAILEEVLSHLDKESRELSGKLPMSDTVAEGETMASLSGPVMSMKTSTAESVAKPLSPERRTELRLIEKVGRHWIDGVLEHSVEDRCRMILTARRCDAKIRLPWEHQEEEAHTRASETVDTSAGMTGVLEHADRALLILGDAGGGKSTLLLELTRELLEHAAKDSNAPLPVVLNLSSWARQGGSIAQWVVDELVAKYQLPRRLGRVWLESERLLLLLDDFDGTQAGRRDCVAAVNEFREQHGLVGLVVCGRSEDYPGQGERRLRMGGAVELLAPTLEQLEQTLSAAEPKLAAILEHDTELRELARSPLMLSLLRTVFAERNSESQEESADRSTTGGALQRDTGDETPLRERLFSTFVRRALKRRAPAGLDGGHMRDRLGRLAAGMQANRQRVFLIEQLQPSWLPSRALQWLYLVLTRVVAAVLICASLWLVHGLLARFGVPRPLSSAHLVGAQRLGMPGAFGELLSLALLGLAASPALILVDGLTYERRRDRARSSEGNTGGFDLSLLGLRFVALFGVLVGLFQFVDTLIGAISAVSIVLILNIFLLVQRGSPGFDAEIEPVEALGWSWPQALRWGALAVPLNLGPAGVLLYLDYPMATASFVVVTGALFVGVCAGLQHRELDARSKPNLGTTLSLRNALVASAMVAGAQLPLYMIWWRDFGTTALGFATAALVTACSFGLIAVYEHIVLRVLLGLSGYLPVQLVPTLEHAVSCGLMRRVGGGYMFTHALLHEYFAELSLNGEAGAATMPIARTNPS